MTYQFRRITLFGRPRPTDTEFTSVLENLYHYLTDLGIEAAVEQDTAAHLENSTLPVIAMSELDDQCDCIIVIGGDGSFLNAARSAVDLNIPIIGINRGRLGFLTDIHPDELTKELTPVLEGNFIEEKRFLLNAKVHDERGTTELGDALNDVVLRPGPVPQMIEFEIFIDDKLVNHQRADGLIVATPTGSTAYALSGGGPILHPELDAVALVPMFPHTLSSRPIVIDSRHDITICLNQENGISARLSCDGHERIPLSPGSKITISRKPELLRLFHPRHYNYFKTLRTKLKWESSH